VTRPGNDKVPLQAAAMDRDFGESNLYEALRGGCNENTALSHHKSSSNGIVSNKWLYRFDLHVRSIRRN
jgi:hypothetical protein